MDDNKLAARTARRILDFFVVNGWTNKADGLSPKGKIVGPHSLEAARYNIIGAMKLMGVSPRAQKVLVKKVTEEHSWENFNYSLSRGAVMKTLRTIIKQG